MNTFKKIATSALLALSIGATAVSAPAFAGKRDRDVLLGIAAGIVGGAIIANEISRSKHRGHAPRHYREPAYAAPRAPEIYVEPRRSRHFEHRRVRHNDYRRPRLSRHERHVRRCEREYRSYDRRSDTFIGYDGVERQCRL